MRSIEALKERLRDSVAAATFVGKEEVIEPIPGEVVGRNIFRGILTVRSYQENKDVPVRAGKVREAWGL